MSNSNQPLLGISVSTGDDFHGSPKFYRNPKFKIFATITSVLIIIMVGVILFVLLYKEKEELPPLANSMSLASILTSLNNLYTIAMANNGSRTAITGYNASVAYILQQLQENTNYQVSVQEFQLSFFMEVQPPTFTQTYPSPLTFGDLADFRNIRYGGSGSVTGNLSYVGGGCDAADYASFTPGRIALMIRGGLLDCNMTTKFQTANQYEAAALVMINDPELVGLFSAGNVEMQPLIGFAVTYQMGQYLLSVLQVETIQVQMFANNVAPMVGTSNIIADTLSGDASSTIVIGSHLDSVLAGPGINDDGSGSAVNLELAIALSKLGVSTSNRIRFCWFAAEELGLVGSTYYVNSLNAQQRAEIALMLNFDMLGSPNYFYGVYNGSSGNSDIRAASTVIQQDFESFFNNFNTPYELTDFSGRSDYGPFIAVGIPAGGLFTGAEVIKTPAQRDIYGGIANAAYDPCYHLACDDIDNINSDALQINSQVAASVLEKFAFMSNIRGYLSGSS